MSVSIQKKLGRRDFLKAAGLASTGVLFVACAPQAPAGDQPGGAPADKGPVALRGTGSMSIDMINQFLGVIKPKLDEKNITLEMTATTFGA